MHFSENLSGVNPVVINYKIRHKNRQTTRPMRSHSIALLRALVNCGQLMNIATFSTRDLREQGRKSYVVSYWANEELVISRMFSHKLCQ